MLLCRFRAGQKAFAVGAANDIIPNNTIQCGEGELEYFRHTLLYNSLRTTPSRYLVQDKGVSNMYPFPVTPTRTVQLQSQRLRCRLSLHSVQSVAVILPISCLRAMLSSTPTLHTQFLHQNTWAEETAQSELS